MRDAFRRPAGLLRALLCGLVIAAPGVAQDESFRASSELGLDPVFSDGFESAECAAWSASSNPFGAPDVDTDTFGDLAQPTTFCQLPAGMVPDATDCDDGDDATYPGAPELCDLADNDCDQDLGDDGAGEPWLGEACDGTGDTDLCAEGVRQCVNGSPACDDQTSSTIDVCNGEDDDCDPGSIDGSEDPLLGLSCDSAEDSDFCATGTNGCTNGNLVCSDDAASTVEACAGDGADEDCDGQTDEGFPRNGNPACSAGTFVLGTLSGDTGQGQLTDGWYGESWDSFTLSENNDGDVYLSATIQLYSPPGVDYDLYLYCFTCGGAPVASSTTHNLTGHFDTVHTRANDDPFGEDDTHVVIVEIRHFDSTLCAYWSLTVTGNTTVASQTCNP